MAQNYEDSKITFQQIVMKQLIVLQKILSKELRDGKKEIKNLIGTQTIEEEDTRYSYLQSAEFFGSLLSPYFSPEIKENFEIFCELLDIELMVALDDKDFIDGLKIAFSLKQVTKTDEKYLEQFNVYLLNLKIKEARKIVRQLIKLFKDKDFLNNESYSEGSSQEDDGLDADGDIEEGAIEE
jgi:hypothetical protein